MCRLPVLAGTAGALGASGALGATYCSPYLSVDGAYNARSSSQMSSLLGASRSVLRVFLIKSVIYSICLGGKNSCT